MNKKYETHKSSILGIDANLVSLLIYLLPFLCALVFFNSNVSYLTWILPLIILIFEKESKLVKFHAWQCLLMTFIYGLLGFLGRAIAFGATLTTMFTQNAGGLAMTMGFIVVMGVISVVVAVLQVIAAVKAFGWVSYRLPIIGKWASSLSHENDK